MKCQTTNFELGYFHLSTAVTQNPSTTPSFLRSAVPSFIDSTNSVSFPMNPPERRPSFGMLLRRSKSGDLVKGGKKAQALREAELERQRQANRVPPKLPEFANNTEQLSKSFGVDLRPSSSSNYRQNRYDSGSGRPSMEPTYGYTSNVPMPPIPNGGFDPYARNESMTHRGRYSYASSAVSTINSPRRVRRRKDPTPFKLVILHCHTKYVVCG